ncbi:MAG TPA: hypothetical protein VH479_01475 [Acidimicrobiales bacterium]
MRDTILVTPELLQRLRLAGRKAGKPKDVTIAGRQVFFGGANLRCSRLDVVADEIVGPPVADPADNLHVTAPPQVEFGIVGLRGPDATITALAAGPGAGATVHGGAGAPGKPGDAGVPTLGGTDIGDPPPEPPLPGPGGDGGDAGDGGPSGQLTVGIAGPVLVDAHWLSEGGRGGVGGKGGEGDPSGSPGDDGDPGTAVQPITRPVTEREFADEQIRLIVFSFEGPGPRLFNQHLERSTLDRLRHGDLPAFRRDLARYDRVFNPGPGEAAPFTPRLAEVEAARRRHAEHRDHVGLARDLDVEPVIDRYATTRADVAKGIDHTVFPVALVHQLFHNMPGDQLRARALPLADMLDGYHVTGPDGSVAAAGILARQAADIGAVQERLDLLRDQAAGHMADVLLAGGPPVDAAALAEALGALPERAVALPALPELAVTATRAAQGPFAPDDPGMAAVLASARDARHVAEWAPGSPVPEAGVHLGRVIDQLATATADDPAVLAGLRELADLVRQQLRCELRSRQAAAAAAERDELAAEAATAAARLRELVAQPDAASVDVAEALLDGIRVTTDAVAWDATFDDRALALRTGDLGRAESVWTAWADALAIDTILDWHEAPWKDAGPLGSAPDPDDPAILLAQFNTSELDRSLAQFLHHTNGSQRGEHAQRGLLLAPTNSRLTITRVFDENDGADVVARLRDTESCWFDIPVDALPTGADGTVRYHEVVAAGASVRLVGARSLFPHDVELRHSGRGRLRLIGDGTVVPQPLSPETVSIAMRAEADGTFGIAPTPETPAFTLAGRAVAAPWSLRLPEGGADLSDLTAIEVQIDLEAFVPAGAVTLRRITSPVEQMVPGTVAKATVELTGPAPAGGFPVQVTSSHPEIAAPANAVVPAGATGAQFDIDVKAPSGDKHVVLTARAADGASARLVLEIPIPPFPDVERVPTPGTAPARSVATLGDRTFVVVSPTPPSLSAPPVDDDDPVAVPDGAPEPDKLVAFDQALHPTAQVTAGIGTRQVVTDPVRKRIYVVTSGANGPGGFSGAGVTAFSADTLKPVASWTTGAGVAFAALDGPAGLLYVSHWIGRRVFVLRASDLAQVGEIGDASFTGPLGLAVDPGRRRIYVARTFRSAEPNVEALTVIERRPDGSHAIGRTIPMGTTVQPYHVAVDPTLGLVYVMGIGGGGVHPQIVVLDQASLAERGRVLTISGPGTGRTLATREGTGIVHTTGGVGVQIIDAQRLAAVGLVPSPLAATVSAAGPDQMLSASTQGELIRLRAPRQITLAEWR